MTLDVIALRDFYSQRLGIVARRLINRGIHVRWPNAQGQRVLGLGYPTPYLGLFREDSARCIAFMPAARGHADGVGRGAVHAAGPGRLVSALRHGVGGRRGGAVAAVRRRSYRRSHQAGLSRDPGAPRTYAADSGAGAGAGAVVAAAG